MNKVDIYKIQRFVDSLLVATCSLFVDGVQRITFETTIIPLWIWTFLIYYTSSGSTKLYKISSKRFVEIVGKLTSTWILTICLLLAILYLSKVSSTISRSSSIEWCIICVIITLSTNIIAFRLTKKRSKWVRPNEKILLWGNKESFNLMTSKQKNSKKGGRLGNIAWFSQTNYGDENNMGGIQEMHKWLERNKPNKIIFVQEEETSMFTLDLIKIFGCTTASVYILPNWYNESMSLNPEEVYNENLVRVWGSNKSKVDENIKRMFDVIFSLASLFLLSPIFVAIGILIKIDSSGPIFFTQKRGGLDGSTFDMIKFRSMYFMGNDNMNEDIKQAANNDQRVTAIGKIMRKWSIDELPQLINVLKGDMTIVGPRPHAIQHDKKYSVLIDGYTQRHSVKPGMTGLAQVRGFRGETKTINEMKNRVFSDLMYQRSWSLKNDIGIILETISVLGSKNSY